MVKLDPSLIVIRPPFEENSVLIAVTGGCSWNKCKFCGSYKGMHGKITQEYTIRPLQDVINEIDAFAAQNYHGLPVFLAGGNPTSAPTEYLVTILKHIREKFKDVPRISCYCKALDILRKSDEELKQLADAGLNLVFIGFESGSSKVLRYMKKGTNAESYIKAAKRLLNSGIQVILYVILGLGSYELSEEHVRETARVLTEINPTIIRFRCLNIIPTSALWKEWKNGDFKQLKPVECIKEERDIITKLGENVTSQVFNEHTSISNFCTIQSLNIKEDREKFIKNLESLINDPQIQNLPRENRLDQMLTSVNYNLSRREKRKEIIEGFQNSE